MPLALGGPGGGELAGIGTTALLYVLVVTSIVGAVITWAFRIETTGVNLDAIGRKTSVGTRQGLTDKATR